MSVLDIMKYVSKTPGNIPVNNKSNVRLEICRDPSHIYFSYCVSNYGEFGIEYKMAALLPSITSTATLINIESDVAFHENCYGQLVEERTL